MPVCEHLVQFYDSERELLETVVPFLAGGLAAEEPVMVIATAEHRRAFDAELRELEFDLEQARADGLYVALDAVQTLECIRPHGTMQQEAFDEVIGGLVPPSVADQRPMRAYGEMVGLLWEEGDTAAAIELERMWNELLDEEPLTLFCAYPTPDSPHHVQAIRRICGSHSAVVPSLVACEPQAAGAALNAEFSPDLESPRRARALLRSVLEELQLNDDLIERGMLAASELAANAVVHAHTPFRLLVQPKPSSVWIGVEDRAPLRHRREVIGRVPHGLGLVASLALRWGVTPCETGKLVWAELPLEPMSQARPQE